MPVDLAAYRKRYALYRTDPDLKEAHRLVPWVVTWDDHEVMNDYANLANRESLPPSIFGPRRAAAYQAYFEHMPIRPSLWRSRPSPRLFRSVDWGELVSMSVLDTRQYRSSPPCSAPNTARNGTIDHCADVIRPDRTIMGAQQEAWLARRLGNERRPWTLIAQQIFFAPLALDKSGQKIWSDQWDRYAANRQRVLDQLASPDVRNAVVLSGDIHSFWINELRRDALTGQGGTIGMEIVTSALAAQSPPAGRFGDMAANNPHIRFSDVERSGYVLLDITPDHLLGEIRAIDRRHRDAIAVTVRRVMLENGSRAIQLA